MDDDGDMAEMYLSEKKSRAEQTAIAEHRPNGARSELDFGSSKTAPVSPVSSSSGLAQLEKVPSSKSSSSAIHIEELEMLLEAYFVVVDNTLTNLLSVSHS